MDLKNTQNINDSIQLFINIACLLLLVINIFVSRFLQKFNDLMPVMYKLKLRVIYLIPILTIISSIFLYMSLIQIKSYTFSFAVLILGIFCIQFSFLLMFYGVLYFSYFSGKILDKLHVNYKRKWYLDETGFKLTILMAFMIIFLPVKIISLSTSVSPETLKLYSFYLFSGLNMAIIVYILSMVKVRKHFDRMIFTYIEDITVAEEIYKEEHKRYMAYKYNSQFQKD